MSIATEIMAIIMSFITMISSIAGIIAEKPDFVPDQGFETKQENAIRIMSFNIRCTTVGRMDREDRVPLVTETILEADADSFGVQEATTEWMADLDEMVGDIYAHVGVGRDDGVDAGEHSAIFYLKDKYKVIDHGDFWLSETPDVLSVDCGGQYRICTWVILENKETGEQYVHINAHFNNSSAEARAHSVDLILDKAAEFDKLPVVFTADMNVEEGSVDYKNITNNGTLKDSKYAAGSTMSFLTYHDTHPRRNQDQIIDYIMINSGFKALTYRVVTQGVNGNYVSDHYPIYSDLIFA